MGKDNKEKKERVLTDAEKKRLEKFEILSDEMTQQNYTRKDLTIDLNEANKNMVLLLIPLTVIESVANPHLGWGNRQSRGDA